MAASSEKSVKIAAGHGEPPPARREDALVNQSRQIPSRGTPANPAQSKNASAPPAASAKTATKLWSGRDFPHPCKSVRATLSASRLDAELREISPGSHVPVSEISSHPATPTAPATPASRTTAPCSVIERRSDRREWVGGVVTTKVYVSSRGRVQILQAKRVPRLFTSTGSMVVKATVGRD